MLTNLVIAIIIGGISGYLASILMKSHNSLIRNIILGITGGFIGSLIFEIFGISIGGYFGVIIVSVLGASLIIYIVDRVL